MSTKMHVCKFRKTFTDGVLKSLTVDAAVSWPSEGAAKKHAASVKKGGTDTITGDKWIATNVRVIPLAKMPLAERSRHGLI